MGDYLHTLKDDDDNSPRSGIQKRTPLTAAVTEKMWISFEWNLLSILCAKSFSTSATTQAFVSEAG